MQLLDFLFQQPPRTLHVCNAPSPAATSAIPIAKHICDQVAKVDAEPVAGPKLDASQ